MKVDFHMPGNKGLWRRSALVVLVTCTWHTNTRSSVFLVHNLIVHWVCVWVSNSCLHRTHHRCCYQANAKAAPTPPRFKSIAWNMKAQTGFILTEVLRRRHWREPNLLEMRSEMGNGDESGSEEAAAWQITAVCPQIGPTEASPIKSNMASERLQLLT